MAPEEHRNLQWILRYRNFLVREVCEIRNKIEQTGSYVVLCRAIRMVENQGDGEKNSYCPIRYFPISSVELW